jgi:hypothetical protein
MIWNGYCGETELLPKCLNLFCVIQAHFSRGSRVQFPRKQFGLIWSKVNPWVGLYQRISHSNSFKNSIQLLITLVPVVWNFTIVKNWSYFLSVFFSHFWGRRNLPSAPSKHTRLSLVPSAKWKNLQGCVTGTFPNFGRDQNLILL